MVISTGDLERWRNNSISTALKLGFDKLTLDFIKKNANLTIKRGLPPDGMFFGWCIYDSKRPVIEVYQRNLSTEDVTTISMALRSKGMSEELVKVILTVYERVTPAKFFEIYNQSGMDHELIGHLYSNLKKLDHDEKAAVNIQLMFAKARSGLFSGSGRNWRRVLTIMPIVLGYHKGIDELKHS